MDEIKAINRSNTKQKAIVLIRDCVTFVDDKLNFLEHPNYKQLEASQKAIDIDKYFANDRENKII